MLTLTHDFLTNKCIRLVMISDCFHVFADTSRFFYDIQLYSKTLIDHYENPRNVDSFSNDNNIGVGFVGAPACEYVIK